MDAAHILCFPFFLLTGLVLALLRFLFTPVFLLRYARSSHELVCLCFLRVCIFSADVCTVYFWCSARVYTGFVVICSCAHTVLRLLEWNSFFIHFGPSLFQIVQIFFERGNHYALLVIKVDSRLSLSLSVGTACRRLLPLLF